MFPVAINFGHVRRTRVDKIQWKPNNRQKLVCPLYLRSFDYILTCVMSVLFPQYIWWRQQRPTEPYLSKRTQCLAARFIFWNAENHFEISVLRDITHLRSCYYTILTQHRTQTKRTDRSDLLKGKENWWRIFCIPLLTTWSSVFDVRFFR